VLILRVTEIDVTEIECAPGVGALERFERSAALASRKQGG
jgi:hypothetical protein